eukprot:TRINITY_DN14721_c0_g1_i2.p3 TRINITY_DN14721_c0_g1~~TRINITY_DN14721_c0_g1_i2.p3  ORF type:complete len:144 (-),score=34.95 TRINITY_DN14721_c0_g1_i2:83-514(-)
MMHKVSRVSPSWTPSAPTEPAHRAEQRTVIDCESDLEELYLLRDFRDREEQASHLSRVQLQQELERVKAELVTSQTNCLENKLGMDKAEEDASTAEVQSKEFERMLEEVQDELDEALEVIRLQEELDRAVSYTHLTLPTKRIV